MPSWREWMEPSKWLTNVDLIDPRTSKPREANVTIETAKPGSVVGEGGKKSRKVVLTYKGWPKPHAIGATVAKTITSITGTDDPTRWPGTQITLFVTTTKAQSGETVPCIRVKPRAPTKGTADAEAPREAPPPPETSEQAPAREPGAEG